jgi:hypothetical protein
MNVLIETEEKHGKKGDETEEEKYKRMEEGIRRKRKWRVCIAVTKSTFYIFVNCMQCIYTDFFAVLLNAFL